MIKHETEIPAAAVRPQVGERLRLGTPLGAYALDHRVRYLFLEERGVQVLSAYTDRGQVVEAISPFLPGLQCDEQEMADDYGIVFDDLSGPAGLEVNAIKTNRREANHDLDTTTFPHGLDAPTSPFSTRGTFASLNAKSRKLHHSTERGFEGEEPLTFASRVTGMCGRCNASRSLAYAMAVESISHARISEPAQAARLIIAELERLYNHLFDLALCAGAAGWNLGRSSGIGLKRRALRICQAATGHQLLCDAIVPGGLRDGVLADREHIQVLLLMLQEEVEEYLTVLLDQPAIRASWTEVGTLTREAAYALAVVGPVHRASGGAVDVRDLVPYGAYRWLPIRVAHEEKGDVLARCAIKMSEVRDSFRLVFQAFETLGSDQLDRTAIVAPGVGEAVTVVEGPRGAETVALTVRAGIIWRVHFISASYRNWPAVRHVAASDIVFDSPLVTRSFNLCHHCGSH